MHDDDLPFGRQGSQRVTQPEHLLFRFVDEVLQRPFAKPLISTARAP